MHSTWPLILRASKLSYWQITARCKFIDWLIDWLIDCDVGFKPFDLQAQGVALQWMSYVKCGVCYGPNCSCIKPLSDRSDMISEVTKCSKIEIFPRPQWGSLQHSQDPLAHCSLPKNLTTHSQPFGSHFCGSRGLTHYRVGNPSYICVCIYCIVAVLDASMVKQCLFMVRLER